MRSVLFAPLDHLVLQNLGSARMVRAGIRRTAPRGPPSLTPRPARSRWPIAPARSGPPLADQYLPGHVRRGSPPWPAAPAPTLTLTLTQPESMIITCEASSPSRHSTDPARKICSTPAAASASRSGSASAFQKLRVVGRSHRTFPAFTGTSITSPAWSAWSPPSAVSSNSSKRPPLTAPPGDQQELRLGHHSPRRMNEPYEDYANANFPQAAPLSGRV